VKLMATVGSPPSSVYNSMNNIVVNGKSQVHVEPIDPKRVTEFHQLFESKLDKDEMLIEDFTCALQKERMLVHGRIYISEKHVCFYSQLFGVTLKVIPLIEIIELFKRNTALVFPNAIEIVTREKSKHFFTSFIFRDQAYQSLWDAWIMAQRGEWMERIERTAEGEITGIKTEEHNISREQDDKSIETEKNLANEVSKFLSQIT